jgi:hypothetical protein
MGCGKKMDAEARNGRGREKTGKEEGRGKLDKLHQLVESGGTQESVLWSQ